MTMVNAGPVKDTVDWAKLEAQARKRLVWKEGRLLLPACLAVVVLAVIGMVAWGMAPAQQINDNASAFIALALGGATMAALVCGCMAFAPERETRTDAFLARLPIDGAKLARTKIWTATVYFLASYFLSVAIAVGLFAVFFNGNNLLWLLGSPAVLGPMLIVAILMPVIVFLWSLAFSRYQSSTLSVVITAAICAVVVPAVIAVLISITDEFLSFPAGLEAVLFFGMFPVKIVTLLFVIGYQHGAWLRPVSVADQFAAGATARTNVYPRSKAGFKRSMRSLLWHSFRLHWAGVLVVALVCGLYLLSVIVSFNAVVMAAGIEWSCFLVEYLNDLFAAAIGMMSGIFLFARDQRQGSYKFFQQRADYPRRLWLARIASMLVIGALVVLVVGVVNQLLYSTVVSQLQTFRMGRDLGGFENLIQWRGGSYEYSRHFSEYVLPADSMSYFYLLTFRAATMFFVVAAVGQLVSIFCRHGILNALLGVVFCFLAAFWIRHVNWYQVSPLAYAWPIGLAALGLSWAYAPSWIRGTRQFSWSVFSTVAMLVVVIGCVVCLRADRLNDYEQHAFFSDLEELYFKPEKLKAAGDPRFDVAKKIESAKRPIDLAWVDLQDEGVGSTMQEKNDLKFSEAELKLVDEHAEAFEEISRLVMDPNIRYLYAQSPDAAESVKQSKAMGLYRVLDLYCAATEKQDGKRFDALLAKLGLNANQFAFDDRWRVADLLDWGDEKDRTIGELEAAISEVDKFLKTRQTSGREFVFEMTYNGLFHECFQDEQEDVQGFGDLPWELERSKRRFANDLFVRYRDSFSSDWLQNAGLNSLEFAGSLRPRSQAEAPMRREYTGLNVDDLKLDLSVCSYVLRQLRYLKMRFALAAWKLEHGSYPDKLSEIFSKHIPEEEKVGDNEWFAYYPEGLDKPVVLSSPYDAQRYRNGTTEFLPTVTAAVIPAKTPFLLPWRAAPTETGLFRVEHRSEDKTEVLSVSEPEVGYLMGGSRELENWRFQPNDYVEEYILNQ